MRFHATRTRDRGRPAAPLLCVSRDHADERAERIRNTCADGVTVVEVLGRDFHRHAWKVLLRWERPRAGMTGPFAGDRAWRRRPQ